MKKTTKRILAVILGIAVVLTAVLVPVSVLAVSTPETLDGDSYKVPNLWADPENNLTAEDIAAFESGDKTTMTGAVGLHRIQNSGNYYLFLPSNTDCTALRFWFTTSEAVTLDGTELHNGETTDVLSSINEGGSTMNCTLQIGSASYSVTAMKSGDVGAVYIDTQSGSIASINADKSNVESGTILVTRPDGSVDYDGVLASMHGRGNASWDYNNKKPYSIKLDQNTKLLGMSKSKKWALIANPAGLDASMLRNQMIYDFSDYVGVRFQVHSKPVDLYVNQQYFGTYQLTERAQIKSTRIDIIDAYENLELANPDVDVDNAPANTVSQSNSSNIGQKEYSESLVDPEDVTGGYLYELEISRRWVEEAAGFCAYNKQGWTMKSCDRASPGMINYSYDLLFALGSAVYNNGVVPSTATSHKYGSGLFSTTVNNPAPAAQYHGKKWSDLLDAQSAVIFYWTQEYFMNLDSSTTSTYFYKNSDSIDTKLYAGPVWDMDNSWCYDKSGSRWGHSYTNAQDWYAKNCAIYRWNQNDMLTTYTAGSRVPRTLYGALCYNCPEFWSMAEDYWYSRIEPATQILLGNEEDSTGKLHSVAWYTSQIEKSAKMNNVRHGESAYNAATVTSKMTAWLNKRNTWLNGQISTRSLENATADVIPDQPYDGTEKTPPITLHYGDMLLEEGYDYDLSYTDNTDVGTATVTATGKGRYTGSASTTFEIVKGSVPQAVLPATAHPGDSLTASIPEVLQSAVTYQWRADGEAISGATAAEYTVTAADVGKAITVALTGDNIRLQNSTVLSNECTVEEDITPVEYTATIASWHYDYTADPLHFSDENNAGEYRYAATDGEKAAQSRLYASINAVDPAEVNWSDVGDEFNQPVGTLPKDRVPAIEPSASKGVAWGAYPYFETAVPTTDYKDITFSARIGGTKKGPSTWKLQYSLDGATFTDVENTTYTITVNKTMTDAFTEVALPSVCDDQAMVYLRVVAAADTIVSSATTSYLTEATQYSGAAAINNIEVKGAMLHPITELNAPEIIPSSATEALYSTDTVTLRDTNGGAALYYSIDGAEPQLYTNAFQPFAAGAQRGDTVTVTAYAQMAGLRSASAAATLTYRGDNIVGFRYAKFPDNETDGKVFSTEGAYGKSAVMTADADGTSQYPPMWKEKNKAFCIAPDDGLKWTETSGFTFEVNTVGFTDIAFACQAYTTASGPRSATLQYSTDGSTWNDIDGAKNAVLPTALSDYITDLSLPAACAGCEKLYLRLITEENATNGGDTLHRNLSKGNLYINHIVISGIADGALKMPYTEKVSNYFGGGAVKYISPDGAPMRYTVTSPDGGIIASGDYPSAGIAIASLEGFNPAVAGPYTVSVFCEDGDRRSATLTKEFYYKGDTITAFKYNSSDRPLSAYLDESGTVAFHTGTDIAQGNLSTLRMYPNASDAAALNYTDTYGVKVEWKADNRYTATKNLDRPSGNGYWLIETSTKGYRDITLNLEQLSSNKGPRDWGVAYSTNGLVYTYVENSNARAINNDAYGKTVETYRSLPLPETCNDKNKLYIKVFINGGEAVDGTELDDPTLTKGNTGMNNIVLSGIPITNEFEFSVTTVLLESPDGTYGGFTVDVPVKVNGHSVDSDGSESVTVNAGDTITVLANAGSPFEREITLTANANQPHLVIPVITIDFNNDGIINAKDYAAILKLSSPELKTKYTGIFPAFLNVTAENTTYPPLA